MLACARFGDDTGLSHAFSEQSLTQYLVGFVSAPMHQIFSLEVKRRLRALCEIAAKREWRRAATEVTQKIR